MFFISGFIPLCRYCLLSLCLDLSLSFRRYLFLYFCMSFFLYVFIYCIMYFFISLFLCVVYVVWVFLCFFRYVCRSFFMS